MRNRGDLDVHLFDEHEDHDGHGDDRRTVHDNSGHEFASFRLYTIPLRGQMQVAIFSKNQARKRSWSMSMQTLALWGRPR